MARPKLIQRGAQATSKLLLVGGLEHLCFSIQLGIIIPTVFFFLTGVGKPPGHGRVRRLAFLWLFRSKTSYFNLLAVVGAVVFHQLGQLFQHDQWCTSLEITSPYILVTTMSQRLIRL